MEESWLGILVTNVLGCLLFGLVVGLSMARGLLGPQQLLFVTTGFLGAFTTFSTFSFDANRMWMDGQTTLGFLYVGGTNLLGLAACWLGLQLAGLWPSGS
jgi:CrcB protein